MINKIYINNNKCLTHKYQHIIINAVSMFNITLYIHIPSFSFVLLLIIIISFYYFSHTLRVFTEPQKEMSFDFLLQTQK